MSGWLLRTTQTGSNTSIAVYRFSICFVSFPIAKSAPDKGMLFPCNNVTNRLNPFALINDL